MSGEPVTADVTYFSNSDHGEWWMNRWCYRCAHDHNFHGDDKSQTDPCGHQCALYVHQHDPVFIPDDTHHWVCVEFTRCACDRGPDDPGVEPVPSPDPNQLALFDPSTVAAGVPADIWHDTFQKAGAPS